MGVSLLPAFGGAWGAGRWLVLREGSASEALLVASDPAGTETDSVCAVAACGAGRLRACESEGGEASLVRSAVEALPVVGCFVGGAPWFAAVYVPLVALARQVDAPSGAAALAALLLYSTGTALLGSSNPFFELPMLAAALAALGYQQLGAEAPGGDRDGAPPATQQDDVFASFDARLNDRVSRSRRRRKDER